MWVIWRPSKRSRESAANQTKPSYYIATMKEAPLVLAEQNQQDRCRESMFDMVYLPNADALHVTQSCRPRGS